MAALVHLRLGNIFDGPSDLVVLPCSTAGTITRFVATALREYRIPNPEMSYELGQVDILPFTGGENIAQYVAFAASVRGMSSTTTAIRLIGTRLGSATQEYSSVRAVSAPLLGAGAGGIQSESVVDSLAEGFKSKAHSDAVLTISILHEDVFRRLTGHVKSSQADSAQQARAQKRVRVFISYTGANQDQRDWVLGLATYLRTNGIEARLDQWHLRKGMDLAQWMTNELEMADRVIIISDEQYALKADGRLGGVGWETKIIQGDLLSLPADNNKYLAIIREYDFGKGIPKYLKTMYCFHCAPADNDRQIREELLKELYNIQLAPPVGQPPVWV